MIWLAWAERLAAQSRRLSSHDGIPGVGVTRRRDVTRRHQAIDELLVVRPEFKLQRFGIAVPLRLGARAGYDGADEPVLKDPRRGERNRRRAALGRVSGDRLRDFN